MLHFRKSEDQNQSQGARITELEYRYLKRGGGDIPPTTVGTTNHF